MKYCSHCGKPLNDNNKFCTACGAEQTADFIDQKKSIRLPAAVVTLAVITLLGSAFGIIRGIFYQIFSHDFQKIMDEENGYVRGYILVFLNVATFLAAILMLKMKRNGYYLYLIFQSLYLAFTLYITFIYAGENKGDFNPWVFLMSALFWFPSGILLVLYLTIARKHFTKNL